MENEEKTFKDNWKILRDLRGETVIYLNDRLLTNVTGYSFGRSADSRRETLILEIAPHNLEFNTVDFSKDYTLEDLLPNNEENKALLDKLRDLSGQDED